MLPLFRARGADGRFSLTSEHEIGRDGQEQEQGEEQALLQFGQFAPAVLLGAAAALRDEMLFPLLHAESCGEASRLRQYQALTAA